MRRILVTGGAGFIGCNFIPRFLASHHDVSILNLDLLTYAANASALASLARSGDDRYRFKEGDIRDFELLRRLFSEHSFDGVIHFAAESHVDNSISGPRVFVETNVVGTFNLLEAAREAWMSAPGVARPEGPHRFHHISTDEVFGSLGTEGYFTELSAYDPSSPYSASKAASDMLVRCYHRTYGLDVVLTNCSNNFGPHQHDEKLIPTVIRSALAGKPIPVYGDGRNVRDWLFVGDHAHAIDLVFHGGRAGETYNIGARNEVSNLDLVERICAALDELAPCSGRRYREQISFVRDRPGHDRRYAIDPTKITSELGFRPADTFDTTLRSTVEWYLSKYRARAS